MTPDDPRHGTVAGAMQHWRDSEPVCLPCSKAHRRYAILCEIDRAKGNPRLTRLGEDAHAVIAGTTRTQLARATGLTPHKLSRLFYSGPDTRVNRRTRDRILAARRGYYWTAIGIQRRLRALCAIGWSMRALEQETGDLGSGQLLRLLTRPSPQFVCRDFAERIIAAYERLSMTPREGRGATRARNRAAANGWAPPLAFDDIDDPDERPSSMDDTPRSHDDVDPTNVERLLLGEHVDSTHAEKVEAMRVWLSWGKSENSLCEMHGWRASRYVMREDGAA